MALVNVNIAMVPLVFCDSRLYEKQPAKIREDGENRPNLWITSLVGRSLGGKLFRRGALAVGPFDAAGSSRPERTDAVLDA